jgi:uncharacterized repeat protein (TIGR01451 family)
VRIVQSLIVSIILVAGCCHSPKTRPVGGPLCAPPVDQSGRAPAPALPPQTVGANRIPIDVNRPADGVDPRILVPPSFGSTPGPTVGPSLGPSGGLPASRLDVKTRASADRVPVGEKVTFEITVTNLGQSAATGLQVVDHFDEGLEHAVSPSPIRMPYGIDLQPGESKSVGVEFRITRAGQLCHTVDVSGQGGLHGTARGCITGVASREPTASAARPGRGEGTILASPLDLALGELQNAVTVDHEFTYVLRVTNRGPTSDGDLDVAVILPPSMYVSMPETSGPHGSQASSELRDEVRTVRFTPVARIANGETLEVRVRVKPTAAGDLPVKAQVTSRNAHEPMLITRITRVLGEN